MNTVILGIAILAFIVLLLYGALRTLLVSWLEYRLRQQLLRQLEDHPDWIPSEEAVEPVLSHALLSLKHPKSRHDYSLTGLFLALIGAGSMGYGYFLRVGQVAVGLHIGGQICLILGLLLASMGLLARWFAHKKSTDI